MQFSHLHNHTQYSLLDGASSIPKLFKKALADHMPALAITDHGNMFGVFDFVKEAKKYKDENGQLLIKPIIGCEFYVVEDRTRQQFTKDAKDIRCHQLLLAKNKQGYKNLIRLCSLGYTEGLYGKYPRIDKKLLLQYHEGLIATTCCLAASVPRTLLRKGFDAGEQEFKWWLDLFGEDYYVELQRHGIPEQDQVNQDLLKLAAKYQVKVIASNDSHYVNESDSNAHDILLCVNTGELQRTPKMKDMADEDADVKNKRFAFYNNQFFFKTTEEMHHVFADIPFALDNTNEIVSKVETISVTNDLLLPNFPVPPPFKTQEDYLEFLTYEGARLRYKILTPEIEERLQFELGVIRKMGFAGYFLIVSDIIIHAKNSGVLVGPGRGSAAGSVVAYCIGITTVDPIRYQLLFERFLNPERATMPDIDTDFDDIGRGRVVEYIVEKYGRNQVAHIITYGTMAARSSIKDVARVLDLALEESNRLAKLVPERPGISLQDILHLNLQTKEENKYSPEEIQQIQQLQEAYGGEGLVAEVLHEAEKLEGTVRNTGIHAAGIIIGPVDLMEIMPLCKQKDVELYVTQFAGNVVEEVGAIKIDVLGLSNLTIIQDTLNMIQENHGVALQMDQLPLDDALTYKLYQEGDTEGTFQFASTGMKKYLRELRPDCLEDLIAMNALFRPGPMAYIPEYIDRKHGRKKITYDLPEMEEVLKETYGITVYQEQVMLLSQKLAGFSKGDADILRKAMGKKQKEVLLKMKAKFLDGCLSNQHPKEICEKIWTDWEAFAEYAFNKSHSTCYALLAYQTAYLKAHYLSEFMAAVLNVQGNIEAVSHFIQECKNHALTVQGTDVNLSKKGFSVSKDGVIRFGLGAIKGIGEAAVMHLIEERDANGFFQDVFDMVKRLNPKFLNRKSLESLIQAGALETFPNLHRAQYFAVAEGEAQTNLDRIIRYGQKVAQAREQGHGLFSEITIPEPPAPTIPAAPHWTLGELLAKEKEMLGIYISAHPLDHYQFEMAHYGFVPLNELQQEIYRSKPIRIGGYISAVRHLESKKGNPYARFTLTDYSGSYELGIFTEQYLKFRDLLQHENKIYLNGLMRMNQRDGNWEFNIQQIQLLEYAKRHLTKKIRLSMDLDTLNEEMVADISSFARSEGQCELSILIRDAGLGYEVRLHQSGRRMEFQDNMLEWLHQRGIPFQVLAN